MRSMCTKPVSSHLSYYIFASRKRVLAKEARSVYKRHAVWLPFCSCSEWKHSFAIARGCLGLRRCSTGMYTQRCRSSRNAASAYWFKTIRTEEAIWTHPSTTSAAPTFESAGRSWLKNVKGFRLLYIVYVPWGRSFEEAVPPVIF